MLNSSKGQNNEYNVFEAVHWYESIIVMHVRFFFDIPEALTDREKNSNIRIKKIDTFLNQFFVNTNT